MQSDTSIPRLVPSRTLDQSTGKIDVDYSWDGQLAPKVQLTGKVVDNLSGYSLIKKDLDNALRWMKKAEDISAKDLSSGDSGYFQPQDRNAFDDVKAYFVASLTFYGKCFTESAGRGARASRDWLDAEYRTTHDEYMKYRHNFAAHSGDEHIEIAKSFLLLHPKMKRALPYLPTIRSQPDVLLAGSGEHNFSALIQHLGDKVVDKYNKAAYKVFECVDVPGIDFWVDAAKKGQSVSVDNFLKTLSNR
jgi:hypothetical protein